MTRETNVIDNPSTDIRQLVIDMMKAEKLSMFLDLTPEDMGNAKIKIEVKIQKVVNQDSQILIQNGLPVIDLLYDTKE